MKINSWGHVQRPWGYEVRADFTDDTGIIHNEVLTFLKEPSTEELDLAIVARQSQVENRIAAELTQPIEFTKDELLVKIADLEAQTLSFAAEKEALLIERDGLIAEKLLSETAIG